MQNKKLPEDGTYLFRRNKSREWWRLVEVVDGVVSDWKGELSVDCVRGTWSTFTEREREECDGHGVLRIPDKDRDPYIIVADTTLEE